MFIIRASIQFMTDRSDFGIKNVGEFIREQRHAAQLSLRKLSEQAGVSNPYLSQIERGMRKPSAEILQQIAKALRISAETLYLKAGILEERDGDGDLVAAILRDASITERQKQILIDVYESFRVEADDESPDDERAANERNSHSRSGVRASTGS